MTSPRWDGATGWVGGREGGRRRDFLPFRGRRRRERRVNRRLSPKQRRDGSAARRTRRGQLCRTHRYRMGEGLPPPPHSPLNLPPFNPASFPLNGRASLAVIYAARSTTAAAQTRTKSFLQDDPSGSSQLLSPSGISALFRGPQTIRILIEYH